MKKLLKDFRDFIMRGNVIDLAIGIIIGSAFSSVVNSIVNNLLMPPLGLLIGNVDFADLFIVLRQGQGVLPPGATLQMAQDSGAVTLNYGQFVTDLISFLLLAIGVFLIIKGINALENGFKKAEAEKETVPTEKDCPHCYKAIPIEATRCPFCTSQLADSAGKSD
ncbi:MAG: large conductance mechanosensitive channel protein MscL [Chloroflexota bacterium]|nr:large conductance mechanosensitive channel protein MscL [Chloroflexota bacterium]